MAGEHIWVGLDKIIPADLWSRELDLRYNWALLSEPWKELGELLKSADEGESTQLRALAEELRAEIGGSFAEGGNARLGSVEMNAHIRFFGRAIRAVKDVVLIGRAMKDGDESVLAEEFANVKWQEWSREMVESVMIPRCPRAHWLVTQGLIAREIWQQRGKDITTRLAWLKDFYDHVMSLGVYKNEIGRKAYSADAPLEIDRDVNALAVLWKERNPEDTAFFLGPGDGWRVDGPVWEGLQANGIIEQGAIAQGIDLNTIVDTHPGINLEQVDLLEIIEKHPEWAEKFGILFELGSSRSNMEIIRVQERYWKALGQLAKPGAIYIMDDAAIEPIGKSNRRVGHSQMMEEHGEVAGVAPVNRAYIRDGVDLPSSPGARIVPLLEKILMARRHGFRCINMPEIGSEQWWELTVYIQDKEWLEKQTKEHPNALQMPFYYAGSTEEGEIARLTLIFEKVDEGMSDLLDPVLADLPH